MAYLGDITSSLLSTVFMVFLIAAAGYLAGGINIKGISLGSAGVLLLALIYGIIASYVPFFTIGGKNIVLYLTEQKTLADGTTLSATKGLFTMTANFGTSMFVASIGLIAGPKFFRTFNRKSLSYILMGVIIIAIGTFATVAIIQFSSDPNMDSSLAVGLMTGALTSTPGFSAAKEVAMDESKVTAGYGLAYIFGVLGVVFFVQIVPRILKVDMDKERASFIAANATEVKYADQKLTDIDSHGFFPFILAVVFGNLIGCLKIPGINFSLGASGGNLIAGLIIGHFGHIAFINTKVKRETLVFFRELGLCFFLIGAGVPGGVDFISNIRLSYFIYGALITTVPMIVGFVISKYIFKNSLFNNLGSITGGMTSTPALGALIASSGMEEVTNAYAATYPFALFCVVLASRIVVSIM
jgi:putative transport protein